MKLTEEDYLEYLRSFYGEPISSLDHNSNERDNYEFINFVLKEMNTSEDTQVQLTTFGALLILMIAIGVIAAILNC